MEATSEKGYTDHLTIYSTNIVLFRCMHLCLFIFSVRVLLRLMKSAKIKTALNSHAQTHTHTHTQTHLREMGKNESVRRVKRRRMLQRMIRQLLRSVQRRRRLPRSHLLKKVLHLRVLNLSLLRGLIFCTKVRM